MPKTKVSEWDTTAGNNSDVGGTNIAENCAAANMNDALRTIMAQIATARSGSDDSIITGTAGSAGNLGAFNADGDLVAAGTITGTLDFSGATVTGISAALADGDYGDVTVSSSGSVISLDAGVVDTAELAAGAVETAKIADGAVTAAKLADADFGAFTVSSGVASLDADSVDTSQIADGAVTSAKLAAGAGGGMTLLDTVAVTSGSSQSATGLTLTNYKQLLLVFDGVVSGGSSGNLQIAGQNVAAWTGVSDAFRGHVWIDLNTGVGSGIVGNAGVAGAGGSSYSIFNTSLSTASTSVTISSSGSNFGGSGQVLVYGVK